MNSQTDAICVRIQQLDEYIGELKATLVTLKSLSLISDPAALQRIADLLAADPRNEPIEPIEPMAPSIGPAWAPTTDPYGELEFAIGNADDFWCFDYAIIRGESVTLHAVINSETGSFIQDAEPPITVPLDRAVEEAKRLTAAALDWCAENEIEHDEAGWNQDATYFWRSVHCAIAGNGPAIRIPIKMVRRPLNTRNYL